MFSCLFSLDKELKINPIMSCFGVVQNSKSRTKEENPMRRLCCNFQMLSIGWIILGLLFVPGAALAANGFPSASTFLPLLAEGENPTQAAPPTPAEPATPASAAVPAPTPLAAPSVQAAPIPVPAPVTLATYRFSEAQVQELKAAGCQFDAEDTKLAEKMSSRQFDEAQFIAAYQDAKSQGVSPKEYAEALAAMKVLNIPLSDFEAFKTAHAKGATLTDFYNTKTGKKEFYGLGWQLLGVGAFGTIAGGAILGVMKNNDLLPGIIVGSVLTAIGGGVFISGAAITGLGYTQMVPEKLLDTGTVPQIRGYALNPASNPPAASAGTSSEDNTSLPVAVSPLILKQGGGVGMAFTF